MKLIRVKKNDYARIKTGKPLAEKVIGDVRAYIIPYEDGVDIDLVVPLIGGDTVKEVKDRIKKMKKIIMDAESAIKWSEQELKKYV